MSHSTYWIRHFRQNRLEKRINWSQAAWLEPEARANLLPSLRAWQKGETSDGRHLKAAAARYAEKTQDPAYLEAIALFIAEEQKHGANLGRFLDHLEVPRKTFDLGDALFRRVRYFATSMEIWTISVLTVESAAQLFYQALKKGSKNPLLQEICTDILIDEAQHLRFQQERLWEILERKSTFRRQLRFLAYVLFFNVVARMIWLAHRKAFQLGGYDRNRFLDLMTQRLQRYLLRPPGFQWQVQKA